MSASHSLAAVLHAPQISPHCFGVCRFAGGEIAGWAAAWPAQDIFAIVMVLYVLTVVFGFGCVPSRHQFLRFGVQVVRWRNGWRRGFRTAP